MPWSGSTFTRSNGTYSGTSVWTSDAAAGVKIVADRHDIHDQDLATGINACLKKDGGNSATANISMGGYKLTDLAAATATGDALPLSQFNWKDWVPTLGAQGSMTIGSPTINVARYVQIGKLIICRINAGFTTAGSASTYVTFSLPVTAKDGYSGDSAGITDNGSAIGGTVSLSGDNAYVRRYDAGNWSIGIGEGFSSTFIYEAA